MAAATSTLVAAASTPARGRRRRGLDPPRGGRRRLLKTALACSARGSGRPPRWRGGTRSLSSSRRSLSRTPPSWSPAARPDPPPPPVEAPDPARGAPPLDARLSKEAKAAAVYSSDLKRAAQTAQEITAACDVSKVVFDQALRERHMGDLHGLKFDDAVRSKPEAYTAFSSDDRNQEIPVTCFHPPLKNLMVLVGEKR